MQRSYVSSACGGGFHTQCVGRWFRRTVLSGSHLEPERWLVTCTCQCHAEYPTAHARVVA